MAYMIATRKNNKTNSATPAVIKLTRSIDIIMAETPAAYYQIFLCSFISHGQLLGMEELCEKCHCRLDNSGEYLANNTNTDF